MTFKVSLMKMIKPPQLKIPLALEMRIKELLRVARVIVCEEPGCWERHTMRCRLVVEDEKTGQFEDEFNDYCTEHATKNGYCWGCGEFWAGCESFDFNAMQLCSNCRDDPDLTGSDEYEDEDDYGPWDDVP